MSIESGAIELIRKWIELDDKWRVALSDGTEVIHNQLETGQKNKDDRRRWKASMEKTNALMRLKDQVEQQMRGYLKAADQINGASM